MRSELFRIPIELGGVPLLGFGVLLAVWLVGWGITLAVQARRGGDVWGYAQPAAIGAIVIAFIPFFATDGVPIRGYGVMLLIAISTGVAMAVHRARRHGIAADTIFALVFWLFVAGIAGARAFFVIEYWDVAFAGRTLTEKLIGIVQFTEGGLVVYGSVIGGLVAFVWFVRRNGLPMLALADILAPCFLVGLAIGRVGCLLNGCCYGGVCDQPWAVTFPQESPPFADQLVHGQLHGVQIIEDDAGQIGLMQDGQWKRVVRINDFPTPTLVEAVPVWTTAYTQNSPVNLQLADGQNIELAPTTRQRSLPVHPTQIYSTINAALLAWLLWVWFRHRRRDGEVILLLFTLYPISRFVLEIIRTDESAIFGTGLSISQNVSLVALTLAGIGWVLLLRTPRGGRLEEISVPPHQPSRTGPAAMA